jgi:hypothetical protein
VLVRKVPASLRAIDCQTSRGSVNLSRGLTRHLVNLKAALSAWLKTYHTSGLLEGRVRSLPASEDANHASSMKVSRGSFFDLICKLLCLICLLLLEEGLIAIESAQRQSQHQPTASAKECALQLSRTTRLLADAVASPVCKGRATRFALYVLAGYHTKTGDSRGLESCLRVQREICEEAPYICWDALLPRSFMALTCMPDLV